jgi:hypothetical protein
MVGLFPVGRSVIWPSDRKIWFNSKKTRERASLLIRKLAKKTVRIEDSLPLRLWHLAKIAEGSGDKASTVFGKPAKLLHRTANLLPLRWRKTFHCFGTVQNAATLFWRHIIQLRQAITHPLLSRRWKIAKARLILQSALLIRKRKVAVTFHPLRQVFLVSVWS